MQLEIKKVGSDFLKKFNIWEISLGEKTLFPIFYPSDIEPNNEEIWNTIYKERSSFEGFMSAPFNAFAGDLLFKEESPGVLEITVDGDVSVKKEGREVSMDPEKLLREPSEELSDKALTLLSSVTEMSSEEVKDFISNIRKNASSVKKLSEYFIEVEDKFDKRCNPEDCFKAMVEVFGNEARDTLEERLLSKAGVLEKLEVFKI